MLYIFIKVSFAFYGVLQLIKHHFVTDRVLYFMLISLTQQTLIAYERRVL